MEVFVEFKNQETKRLGSQLFPNHEVVMYKIVRCYVDHPERNRTIKKGLNLEEAQKHCRNPQASSRTTTMHRLIRLTKKYGPWFDSYVET